MNSSKIKVLFYFHFYQSLTGGPWTLLSLLENIDRDRYSPFFVTQSENDLLREVKKLDVPSTVVEPDKSVSSQGGQLLRTGPVRKLIEARGLRRFNAQIGNLIEEHDIDVVWSRGSRGVLMTGWAARKQKIPQIWDIALEKQSKGIIKLIHRIGFGLSTVVITEAKCQQEIVFGSRTAHRYRSKLRYIESAIPQHKIDSLSAIQQNPDCGKLRILCIGTIGDRKNQQILVQALEQLKLQGVPAVLDLVGPYEDRESQTKFEALLDESDVADQVVCHGWQDDPVQFYANADVFALCSFNEGVPHVIKEAMFAGLPVVATPVGGIPDVVEHGENGFLESPDDLDSLVSRFSELYQSSEMRLKMGQVGRDTAKRRFDPVEECIAYQKLFDEFCGQKTLQEHP